MPAQAGIQGGRGCIPAFAGMTQAAQIALHWYFQRKYERHEVIEMIFKPRATRALAL
jgi:hypothetical protein